MSWALATLALVMALASFDFGVTWDEPVQQQYGELVFRYFATGFEDRSATSFSNLYLYGGLFDLAAVCAQKLLSAVDRYDVRHLLNAGVGWLGIFFACRTAMLLASARAALLTLLVLALWPAYFGHSMNNPKDVPFAAFYAAGLFYLCRLLRELPTLRPGSMAGFVTATACAINVRAGGILLLGYLALVFGVHALSANREERGGSRGRLVVKLASALVVVGALSLLLGTTFWPWAQSQPFLRPFEALSRLSRFAEGSRVLFDGALQSPWALPWDYAPRWLLLTTPFFVLLGLVLSFWSLSRRGRGAGRWLILVAALFPVAYVVATRPPLYDGVRHLLFVLPSLAVMSAIGFEELFSWAGRIHPLRRARLASAGGLVALLALEPLAFSLRNHPHQYTYFNALAGGARGAFATYELDYWGNCYKESLRWLAEYASSRSRPLEFGAVGAAHLPPLELPTGSNLSFIGEGWTGEATLQLLRGSRRSLEKAVRNEMIIHRIEVDGAPLCLVYGGEHADLVLDTDEDSD